VSRQYYVRMWSAPRNSRVQTDLSFRSGYLVALRSANHGRGRAQHTAESGRACEHITRVAARGRGAGAPA
jgi:hypothetical protein